MKYYTDWVLKQVLVCTKPWSDLICHGWCRWEISSIPPTNTFWLRPLLLNLTFVHPVGNTQRWCWFTRPLFMAYSSSATCAPIVLWVRYEDVGSSSSPAQSTFAQSTHALSSGSHRPVPVIMASDESLPEPLNGLRGRCYTHILITLLVRRTTEFRINELFIIRRNAG